MNRKEKVQCLIQLVAEEVYEFIKENESTQNDDGVPTTTIKDTLELNFVCVPRVNGQGHSGWVFAAIARILEDQDRISYITVGRRSYCKTKQKQLSN